MKNANNDLEQKTFRYIIMAAALAAAIFCISCGQNQQEAEETEQMAEMLTLQPDEIEILSSMYVNEERIQRGELFSYQQDNLERYRFARQYLAEKYPDYDLEIISGEPKSRFMPYAEFAFTQRNNGQKTYKLYVKDMQGELEQKFSKYYAEDNFYESFFAEKYDTYVHNILKREVGHIVRVSSSMPWTKGKEYGSDMAMEDILDGKLELSANTMIFIMDSTATEMSAKETAGTIEKIIQEQNLYGSFQVYIYEDGYPIDNLSNSADVSSGVRYKETFQNFRKEALWEDN